MRSERARMRERFKQFSRELHEAKTLLLEFGRFAPTRRARCGQGKPQTFKLPGFLFICCKTRRGAYQLQHKTRSDRMQTTLQDIKAKLHQRIHDSIPKQGKWLRAVVSGYFAHHAVPTKSTVLTSFRRPPTDLWWRTQRRRGQKDKMTLKRMDDIANRWLPRPRNLRP